MFEVARRNHQMGRSLFENLPNFHTEFDNLFDTISANMNNIFRKEPLFEVLAKATYPKTNVRMDKKDLVFEVAIPYYNPDDVDVNVQDNVLTITGKAASPIEGDYVAKEVSQKAFQRSWKMAKNVDPKAISAKYERGVLFVTVKDYFAEDAPKYEGYKIPIQK